MNTAWNKRTEEEVKHVIEKLGYVFINEFYGKHNHRYVTIKDSEGYKYETELSRITLNHSPIFVGIYNPFSLENISLWLKKNNKNFVLYGENIYRGTNKQLLFKCLSPNCNEIFDSSWNMIYSVDCGCPFCSGRRVGKHNNLEYLRPDLMNEWDYNKNKILPSKYTIGSNESVWWKCEFGHEFFSKISKRTLGNGCKKCSDIRKESKIASDLKIYFKNKYVVDEEHKMFKNPETNQWLRCDIYIPYGENPNLNGFYIEINGEQHYRFVSKWHKTIEKFNYNKNLDKIKKSFARKHGIYIEIDLRKIKTLEDSIEYIENIIKNTI